MLESKLLRSSDTRTGIDPCLTRVGGARMPIGGGGGGGGGGAGTPENKFYFAIQDWSSAYQWEEEEGEEGEEGLQ